MYLPDEIPNAEVLITVKTYPQPSHKYAELVCTAGVLPNGDWVRIYPVCFRDLPYDQQYQKYERIRLNLHRNSPTDFRPESYRPSRGFDEPIQVIESLKTSYNWAHRKAIVLQQVFTSMKSLIELAYSAESRSLATMKPHEIIKFIVEPTEREWKEEWLNKLRQYDIFTLSEKGEGKERQIVRKIPYKYSYRFLTSGDDNPREMMIEDWEIGALFWNCFRQTGSEEQANVLVRQRYEKEFLEQNDIYLFLGTTLEYHRRRVHNPFVIIGVFYPMKAELGEQAAMRF